MLEHGAAVWTRRTSGGDVRVDVAMIELAERVFASLEDVTREVASRLTRTHAEWFERPPPANRLANELVVERVSVPPDLKDATVHLTHGAFAGHTIEAALAPNGRVTYVGLLG